jgi:hypothetical protein
LAPRIHSIIYMKLCEHKVDLFSYFPRTCPIKNKYDCIQYLRSSYIHIPVMNTYMNAHVQYEVHLRCLSRAIALLLMSFERTSIGRSHTHPHRASKTTLSLSSEILFLAILGCICGAHMMRSSELVGIPFTSFFCNHSTRPPVVRRRTAVL